MAATAAATVAATTQHRGKVTRTRPPSRPQRRLPAAPRRARRSLRGERRSEPFVGSLIPWHNCHGGAWNKTLLITHTRKEYPCQWIYHLYTMYIRQMIYHGYQWIYQVYTWSIYVVYPWIYHAYTLIWISMVYPWIYDAYSMYIGEDGICMEYTQYIPGIYRK
jgi:hypothetical protein